MGLYPLCLLEILLSFGLLRRPIKFTRFIVGNRANALVAWWLDSWAMLQYMNGGPDRQGSHSRPTQLRSASTWNCWQWTKVAWTREKCFEEVDASVRSMVVRKCVASAGAVQCVCAVHSMGNESVPKIIINDAIIFLLKLQSAFC